MEQKTISFGMNFAIVVDTSNTPLAYSDERPYRYGLHPNEQQANYWTYPVTRFDKDALLRTVSEFISADKPLSDTTIKALEDRVLSTDKHYTAFQEQIKKTSELCAAGKCTHEAAITEIEQSAQRFRTYLNEPFTS